MAREYLDSSYNTSFATTTTTKTTEPTRELVTYSSPVYDDVQREPTPTKTVEPTRVYEEPVTEPASKMETYNLFPDYQFATTTDRELSPLEPELPPEIVRETVPLLPEELPEEEAPTNYCSFDTSAGSRYCADYGSASDPTTNSTGGTIDPVKLVDPEAFTESIPSTRDAEGVLVPATGYGTGVVQGLQRALVDYFTSTGQPFSLEIDGTLSQATMDATIDALIEIGVLDPSSPPLTDVEVLRLARQYATQIAAAAGSTTNFVPGDVVVLTSSSEQPAQDAPKPNRIFNKKMLSIGGLLVAIHYLVSR